VDLTKRSQLGSFRKIGVCHAVCFAKSLYVVGFAFLLLSATALKESLPQFEDVTAAAGIRFHNSSSHTTRKYLPETMGAGVALFDYNHDGWLDVFFVNGAALSDPMRPNAQPDKTDPKFWNRLYRNNGDGTFTDVTAASRLKGDGYGMGAAVGDYDNDGWPDLYVTSLGHNTLYHNNGDGTFTDVSENAGAAGSGWSTGAMFIDYYRDGRLDLFVARYLDWDFSNDIFCGIAKPGGRAYCHPDQFPPVTYLLFHNEGHGRFRDVSQESGIAHFPGKGLGVAMNDSDGDGWPDIVVANDSFPEQLFRNLQNGKFEEVGLQAGMAFDQDGNTFAGMGVDFADYDNNGWPDIFINALAQQKYALFHNQKGRFDYVSGSSGISADSFNHSGWGTKFIDYDNDGFKDLFIGQGHVMDNIAMTQPEVHYLESPMLLRNLSGRFADVSPQSGPSFRRALASRGVGFGDLNNDGFVDIVINCNDQAAVVLKNTGDQNHWLIVDTVGTKSNRDGIGARLHVVTGDGREQYGIVTTASSYLSASDKRVYFGLGSATSVRLLEIAWPSDIKQHFTNLKSDQIFVAQEAQRSSEP
jgi:enediyne biosynthesis protein E4